MGKSRRKRKTGKRPTQRRRPVLTTLVNRVHERFECEGAVVIPTQGEVRMSEVLEAFVEPYLDLAGDSESLRKLITVAAVSWNAALLP